MPTPAHRIEALGRSDSPTAASAPAAVGLSATTMRRHWRELIRLALDADDAACAAALYPFARDADRARLATRLFAKRRDRLTLAARAFVPPAVLAELACRASAEHDDTLKLRLARNPATPAGALEMLAAGQMQPFSPRLAELLARHVQAPYALLASLAAHSGDLDVLRALCQNVGVASELLTQLEQRGIAVLQRLLAIHLATDAQTLAHLWRTTHASAVRAQVLRHPCCPDDLLCTIPASAAERRSLAMHPRAPANILMLLARDDDAAVRRAAAINFSTPAGALVGLCFDAQPLVRRAVAGRNDIPLKVVDLLSDDIDVWVRSALARSGVCPEYCLERFAKDQEAEVRRAAGRHPRCPPSLLAILARDSAAWVRAGVACREALPRTMLHQLAHDSDVDVLCGVARNCATPQAQLARFASHAIADVRRSVILNRNATRRVLLPLRDESYPLHRMLVFEHPNLSNTDRWRMRMDPDGEVRSRMFGYFGRTLGPVASDSQLAITPWRHHENTRSDQAGRVAR